MALSQGCNHVTIVTKDIDRCIEFYTQIFDAKVRADMDEGALRHALIDMGADFCLHPFQVTWRCEHEAGISEIFARGHVDHFALTIPDRTSFEELRKRLVECGASEGRVRDLPLVHLKPVLVPGQDNRLKDFFLRLKELINKNYKMTSGCLPCGGTFQFVS